MSSVTVITQPLESNVTENVTEVSIEETELGIEISKVVHDVAVQAPANDLTIEESPFEVHVAAGVPGPQGPPGDPGTYEWGGIGGDIEDQSDLQSALSGKFSIADKFSELTTAQDKIDARDNLGLNVIDGGTFV